MRALIAISLIMSLQQVSFKESQLKHRRVKSAYEEKEAVVKEYFRSRQFAYGGFHLFIRAFKQEKLLEVWIKEKEAETTRCLQPILSARAPVCQGQNAGKGISKYQKAYIESITSIQPVRFIYRWV